MIEWRTDWDEAPKDNKRFLVLLKNGYDAYGPLVTTAYFYWYTEDYFESSSHVAYWALQDAVKDVPLDEDGPAELQGLKWAPMPEGV